MFVRRKPNKSGSISIQIVEKRGRRNVVVCSVGCSKEPKQIERLEAEAHTRLEALRPQLELNFGQTERERSALDLLHSGTIQSVGPELILGAIFDKIGFNTIPDDLFKEIVLARLVYPVSKLKTAEYVFQHCGRELDVHRIYRFLDRLNSRYQEQVETIAYNYSRSIVGELLVVFYDMTTLYFEAEDEDDLRRIGFSKDGKFQHPQVMLGLLVGRDGYPISYDIFEGNTSEGRTLLPVIKRAQQRFDLAKPIVVADSGLLSKENVNLLIAEGYEFILGARIKNESRAIQEQIFKAAATLKDKESTVIEKSDGTRLVIDYSEKRAKKDASNRDKGISRLNAQISAGRLTKSSLNQRGYNKFLTIKGELLVGLDQQKIEQDKAWDGLKGYLTNSSRPTSEILASYRQLWKIERAFRISKTDLRIRPIYHRKKERIQAHICVAFVAYTIYKELERLLFQRSIPLSPRKALDLMKTIYQVTLHLPDSQRVHSQFVGISDLQRTLLELAVSLRTQ